MARCTDARRTRARPAPIPVTPTFRTSLPLPSAIRTSLPLPRVVATNVHPRSGSTPHVGAIRKIRLRIAKPIRVWYTRKLNHTPHPRDTARGRMVRIHGRTGTRAWPLRIGVRLIVWARVRAHRLRVPPRPAHAQSGAVVAF